jgi:hypothetical protein
LQEPRAREWKSVNKFYIFYGRSEKIYTKLIIHHRSRPFSADQSEGGHHEQRRQLKILMLPACLAARHVDSGRGRRRAWHAIQRLCAGKRAKGKWKARAREKEKAEVRG